MFEDFDFGGIWDTIQSIIGQGASKAGDLVGGLAQGVADNPYAALNLGMQGAGLAGQIYQGMGQQGQQPIPQGLYSQMAQPAGPTPEMMHRRLADAQSQGLSGASPDFLATLAGVTPDELSQMLGYAYDGSGQQQGGR